MVGPFTRLAPPNLPQAANTRLLPSPAPTKPRKLRRGRAIEIKIAMAALWQSHRATSSNQH